MHIDSFFACANSHLEDAEFVIFGIPYDATQSFKSGSRFAPNAIREASWNIEDYSMYFDCSLQNTRICDAGNINTEGGFYSLIDRVLRFLERVYGTPIALGGEHTISYACVKELKDACYVVFDAHFDLRNELDESRFNHACTVRRIYELGKIDGIVQIGVRSGAREERVFAEKEGIDVYYSWDVLEKGIEWITKRLDYNKIYLSLDMDVFDPAFAPGVSAPEPFGIYPMHLLRFLGEISERIVGMDVAEVVPDSEKVTQTLAAKIVSEFIAAKSISLTR
jgi:agmatinase